MNKLIRVFSYILMILGVVIILGGLGIGITMLVARGTRIMEHSQPFVRMMSSGSAVMAGFIGMLEGLMVSGFGMLLYLVGDIAKPKAPPAVEAPEKKTRAKK